MDNYREYIIQPDGYGVVRFCPLFIANIMGTKLEQWFQDNKFIYQAFREYNTSNYVSQNLQVEFLYSRRVEPKRELAKIKQDVLNQTNAKQYQLLINLIHQCFEMIYECYELFRTPKIGLSVIDLKDDIQRKVAKFEKGNFPKKANIIKKFGKSEELIQFVEEMNAARNCIEHRGGIVDKNKDLKGKTKLSVHWKSPIIHSSKGKVSVTIDIKGGLNTEVIFESGIFEFREGELVKFSFEDNYKLIYTIMVALKTIIDGLYEKFEIDCNKTPEIRKEF
ncbi:MAG: hypothetical protein HN392_05495 [Anaerolineae bacterium]|nr:hypothetical protein [Anaerolineae bacterium]MBT7074848.1 hypothetical protein [Anaerolineae bacterium]